MDISKLLGCVDKNSLIGLLKEFECEDFSVKECSPGHYAFLDRRFTHYVETPTFKGFVGVRKAVTEDDFSEGPNAKIIQDAKKMLMLAILGKAISEMTL